MNFYMVFAGIKQDKLIQWSAQPVGVFRADSAEQACQAAAKKTGFMGNYFALQGTPWGIELFETDADEFGADTTIDPLQRRIAELEKSTGVGDE
jgi:hypothetical protein